MRLQIFFGAVVVLVAFCHSVAAQFPSLTQGPQRILETARAVHNLPPKEAAHARPVRLRAVVTYYDPSVDSAKGALTVNPSHGLLFVHDATGCVYVAVPVRPILPLKAGTLVEITGVSGPGDYASVVIATGVRVVGQSHLPSAPLKVTLPQLLSGAFDSQWVEIEGRVLSVSLQPSNAALEIGTDSGTFAAATVRQEGADYESLVGSLVRIRGNEGVIFNQRRQIVGARVFFPTLREVSIIAVGPRDPFAAPPVPVSGLFQYSPNPGTLSRVHVQGKVSLDWPGQVLCIQNARDGICMQTMQKGSVAVGKLVDVVGFPAINQFKPTLKAATFRADTGPASPPSPVHITAGQAMRDDLDGTLVQIDAELIDQNLASAEPTLMLRAGHVLFSAILPKGSLTETTRPWKNGSLVRITGVSDMDVSRLRIGLGEGAIRPKSLRILLRSAGDISVLHVPSWWTPKHTLEGLAGAGIVVLATFTWIVVLRRRVKMQTQALRESEVRLRHLSERDPLTDLPNRMLLNDRLQAALKRAERSRSCLGLLMVDVDGFKGVNDLLGHQAGDKLLCELACRLSGCARATDTVARIGGDEFIVLLPDLHVAAEAELIAAKIVAAVSSATTLDQAHAVITVSVGVATYPEASTDLEELMRCADEAMYAAKKGKNGFQVYNPRKALLGGYEQVPQRKPQSPMPMGAAFRS